MSSNVERVTVGRIVHYVARPGGEHALSACRAAIVTEATPADAVVGLCVLNPSGFWFNRAVPHDESRTPATWHWPRSCQAG